MEKSKSMKYHGKDIGCNTRLYFAIAFFSLVFLTQGKAQTIQRQSIGICGANIVSDGALVKQTVGQPYAANTYYQNGIGFRPGFQQPSGANAQSSLIGKALVTSNLNMKVFPNPAISSIRIESQEAVSNAMLKIMDSSGRVVLKESVPELKSHSIPCDGWPVGLYLITVSDEQHTSYSSKLIITK